MAFNFIGFDRDQVFLLPPWLREWVPEDHLVWTVLDAVGEMNLDGFYGDYRADGHGRRAYEPAMMVALLLYAYARGNRSSRGIERACVEDVAHRVVAREILAEADEIDRREDELYGEARGDELPERLRTAEGRKAALREAKEKLEREREQQTEPGEPDSAAVEVDLDPGRFVTRPEGRKAWLREGRRALDEQREREARPVARDRADRLFEAARRLEEELAVEHQANIAYEAYRARGVMKDGRPFGVRPKPYQPPEVPAGQVNTTDPDSRLMKTVGPALQGYNAQAAVNENQIVVAAEVTVDPPDFGHLEPMVNATVRELEAVGAPPPQTVVADAGYWHKRQMEAVVSRGMQVLVPPDAGLRKNTRPGWDGGLYAFMRRVLATEQGKALYRKRKATVEPVFGQMKFNRRFDRFQRRGRAACRSEWRLFGASHNLLNKLHTQRIAAAGA